MTYVSPYLTDPKNHPTTGTSPTVGSVSGLQENLGFRIPKGLKDTDYMMADGSVATPIQRDIPIPKLDLTGIKKFSPQSVSEWMGRVGNFPLGFQSNLWSADARQPAYTNFVNALNNPTTTTTTTAATTTPATTPTVQPNVSGILINNALLGNPQYRQAYEMALGTGSTTAIPTSFADNYPTMSDRHRQSINIIGQDNVLGIGYSDFVKGEPARATLASRYNNLGHDWQVNNPVKAQWLSQAPQGIQGAYSGLKRVGDGIKTSWGQLSALDKFTTVGNAVSTLLAYQNSRKMLKQNQQALNMQRDQWNKQYELQRRNYNMNLEDKQRYRVAYAQKNGTSANQPMSVNEYMNKYGAF